MRRAALATLAACAHTGAIDTPAPIEAIALAPASLADGHVSRDEYEANSHDERNSLARLAELEILTAGALIVDAPEGSMNCYGPCEDDPVMQTWMATHARQVERLTTLVATAEELAAKGTEAPYEEAQAALSALSALQIVEIGGMYRASDANCYVGYCPGDPQRAGVIVALAERLSGR